jgi:RloB-like protein
LSRGHRDFRNNRSLSRDKKTREFKRTIFVYCEGKNTESDYLLGLKNDRSNGLVELKFLGAQGTPATVVDKAIVALKELKQAAKRSGNSFDLAFDVWAVFDVDEFPNVDAAKAKALANDVKVGCSNPCFELWLVYHKRPHDAPISHTAIQRLATELFLSYDHAGSKNIDFNELRDHVDSAILHARRGIASRAAEGIPYNNPSTSVVSLVEDIVEDIIRYGMQ